MELELNHAALEAFGLREVLGKFTGEFAVDEELEPIALDDDVDMVPIALTDVRGGESVFDRSDGGLIILGDHEAIAAEATMLAPTGCVEVPRAHYVFANAEMAEVRVVALEIAAARLIRYGTDIYAAVTLAGKAIAELQLKIGHVLVRRVGEITTPLVAVAHDHAVLHRPRRRDLGRSRLPGLKSFTIEHGDEVVLCRSFHRGNPMEKQQSGKKSFHDEMISANSTGMLRSTQSIP